MQKEFEQISERLSKIENALSLKSQSVFITSDEFCELTGMSKNTLYQARKNLPITPYYFGRKLRFKRKEVLDWLNNTVSTTPFSLTSSKR